MASRVEEESPTFHLHIVLLCFYWLSARKRFISSLSQRTEIFKKCPFFTFLGRCWTMCTDSRSLSAKFENRTHYLRGNIIYSLSNRNKSWMGREGFPETAKHIRRMQDAFATMTCINKSSEGAKTTAAQQPKSRNRSSLVLSATTFQCIASLCSRHAYKSCPFCLPVAFMNRACTSYHCMPCSDGQKGRQEGRCSCLPPTYHFLITATPTCSCSSSFYLMPSHYILLPSPPTPSSVHPLTTCQINTPHCIRIVSSFLHSQPLRVFPVVVCNLN